MADRRVKWNMFYYNSSDLAWVVGGLATAVFLVATLQLVRMVPELIRIDSAIGTSLR
jgi:hypothetical protein